MRRSKLDLVLGVLRAVKRGTDKPTRIMYTVNLSWKPTQNILNSLVGQGLLSLIEEEGNKRSKKRYELTEKGNGVVDYFDGAKQLINVDDIVSPN
jgi:predicted transcriptional regulator